MLIKDPLCYYKSLGEALCNDKPVEIIVCKLVVVVVVVFSENLIERVRTRHSPDFWVNVSTLVKELLCCYKSLGEACVVVNLWRWLFLNQWCC